MAIYKATVRFAKEELYGLTSQIRRSCASIAATIAEGCGRNGKAEFARFLQVAMGSASELEYHLLLARDLGLFGDAEYKPFEARTVELKRMLTSLINRIRANNRTAKLITED